ncbi:MAG: thioesterase family protein [Actinomycetota bacterium]|nr:thioesterase family protein [Actinomycetota bacterium]
MSGTDQISPGPVAVHLETTTSGGRRIENFRLTSEARGPWQEDAAHGGAPAALLARTAESYGTEDGLRLAALSATFYGPVMLGEITIESELVKPGRRQRVVSLRLGGGGRTSIDARAVLLRRGEVLLPEDTLAGDRMANPGEGRPVDRRLWADGEGPAFHRSANTVLATEGGPDRIGLTGAAWFRFDAPLVDDEPASPAQRAIAASDFGNGLAHPVPFGEFLFANCDLNFSLLRDPAGDWIGLRSRTEVDPGGAGLTTSEVFDATGRVGAATQTLYVDRA